MAPTTGTITVDTTGLDDALVEGSETVSITLTSTDNGDVTIGATPSATLAITDDDDNDGDSVAAADEDAGFNGGDGNGDGILDSLQSDVTNVPNPVTGGSTTVDITGSATCNVVSNVAGLAEASLGSTDSSYDYPVGLVQFLIECASAGDTATIEIFYDQVYDTSDWEFRKYNDKTGTYEDIDATVTVSIAPFTLPFGGQQVTKVTYDVTDGSSLDTDANPPLTDRFIFDPAGPGTPVVVASSGGGGGGSGSRQLVCQDPAASNYEDGGNTRHEQDLCEYAVTAEPAAVEEILGSGTCPQHITITQYLRRGGRDGVYDGYTDEVVDEVAILQAHINRILGATYNEAAGPVDGIFGALTERGVRRLQEALNEIVQPNPRLVIDGIVGPFTKAAINNSCGGSHEILSVLDILEEEPTPPSCRFMMQSPPRLSVLNAHSLVSTTR